MAILKIARMGHPVLLTRAAPVEDPTAPGVRALVRDMAETLSDAGGVGLAAPQVHVSQRIILVSAPAERDAGAGAVPLQVMINPEIELIGEPTEAGWEGCLSIPGLRGLVPRHETLRFRALDHRGEQVSGEASGFHARVIQHEMDHLDGILYPARMTDLSQFGFEEELARAAARSAAGDKED